MPMFEFVCRDCKRSFEELMTFAQMENGEAVCPQCGSKKVERNLSTFATKSGMSGGGGGGCGGGGGGGAFT